MLTKKDKNLSSEKKTADEEPMTVPELIKLCISFVLLVGALVFLFRFVLTVNHIPSGSMENTLMIGDTVIATRFDRTDIRRYDIMVFEPPFETDVDYYIKRVIGLPGETIVVDNGNVYADGELLDSSFIPEAMNRSGDGEYHVPEGCYFMMGDNRNHSADARFWENKYVPLENMDAKAWFILFPFTRAGSLRYQNPADGNIAPAPESAFPAGGDDGNHVYTMAQESGSADVVLCCQNCGQQRHVKELQIREEPGDGCVQHRIILVEVGHTQYEEDGMEWVTDSVSLYCKDCSWSASAIPND